MWQWFTTNSVWVFIISAFVLILLYLVRGRAKSWLEKVMPKEWYARMGKSGKIAFWTIEGLALVVIAVALVAVVLSREGVATLVTPETIAKWSLEHGVPILIMLLTGAILWFALNNFLPPLVLRSIHKPKRGESMQGMKKRADTLTGVFLGLGKVIVAVIILFMILSELNVEVGPILAGLGIVGLAVGFGAQYLIRDLIAGIFILMENQYRVGDVASVGGVTALVEEVNLRKTMLRDLDGIVHHVPNGEIKVASNYTRHFSRVNLDVSVSYGTDLDHAISVINRVGQELATDEKWSEHIITPPQVLRVNKFGDSGIDIRILGDCKPLQQWALMGELRLRLKKAFDQEGIEIPWPHVKLYFGQPEVTGLVTCKACSQANLPNNKFCSQCGASLGSS
ncbi:mechanosensitive ion channel domain-containing protein [Chloroflexota bacterium]